MGKINPVKVRQDAEKAERSGRVDQAIVLYQQLVDDNPRDWNTWKKIGDLNQRLNKTRDAIDAYARVADFLAGDGFHVKAIAMWKMINKLDPSAFDPYLKLADLYAKQGLMMEAKGQYQYVVDEHLRRGKVRDAGDVLKKMAEIDPADLKVRSKLADLYLREGNTAKAVDEHVAIAAELNKKGHLAEALQVLEKGLKIDPKNRRIRIDVAGIHLLQKSFDKAIHHLEDAVQHDPSDTATLARLGEAYLGGKRLEEAEGIFKRLLELDPENEENLVNLGRVFLRQGSPDRAFDQYRRVADRLVERKEGEKAASLLQQILQTDSAHVKTLRKLVEIFRVLRKDSLVAQTYSQLTEAYDKSGQIDQAIEILDLLVELEPHNAQHREKLGFFKRRRDEARGAAPPAPRPPTGKEESFDLDFSAPVAPVESRVRTPPVASAAQRAPAVEIELSGILSDDDREFIEEHLGEGKVFRKYGLVDKAAEQFESIVARFPDNLEGRQELRDIFKEKGQTAKAVEQCLALAQIFRLRGDAASAEAQEAEAGSLGGASAPAPPAPAPRPTVPPPPPPEPEPFAIGLEEEVLSFDEPEVAVADSAQAPMADELDLGLPEGVGIGGGFLGDDELDLPPGPAEDLASEPPPPSIAAPEEEEISFGEDLEEPAVAGAPREMRVPPAPAPQAPPLPPDLAKMLAIVDDHMSLGFVDDAAEMLRKAEARHPGHPAIADKRRELGMEEAPLEAEEPLPTFGLGGLEEAALETELGFGPSASVESPLDGLDLPSPLPVPEAAHDAAPPEEPGVDLGFGDLGLEEPEPPALGMAFPEAPEAEEPSALGEELDLGALGATEPELALADGPWSVSADLEEEGESPLGGLFSSTVAVEPPAAEDSVGILGDAGLAEIFKEFKKGVDKQLGKEDYDTRYNLGIAYKEMGLVDEAIAEFQLAAKDESRLLECSSMLGICFMEKGMPALAVKWFEKGLAARGRQQEEYQGLRYDLAAAHEASGNPGMALGLFREIFRKDASFRDVAERVRQLAASPSV